MERRKLEAEEIGKWLAERPAWGVQHGKLFRRFEFPDFSSSLDFVNKAGKIADAADHHPDIRLGWGYAEFEITTHDRGGITPLDFDLAAKIDAIT
ncbi:MAG: 4a-hydroxytetrahydrobiopterin dehydratase [Blastocatellia bacterium]|nr:4a-hydroxytetrahydrobiopterin dehydratase [Chloracidobacterium sp.]MBL8183899.1 4a-hydroxytetrahydrobiopterin dehydratase [Blastocatellia bacterium]HRJ87974.1 4a-hydroxytetrahydrobiopterin dehydratase [Pyrinomonadaceae bacterium]HRK49719.1 4a-hydroxytetrahydrobiopterin dehydratase [Pyrinomonadaceae bacterium]